MQKLTKLSCGIIYTDTFCEYIAEIHADQASAHPKRVLTLDYIRCASGPLKGKAWWQFLWLPQNAVPKYRCFRMGEIVVHIPKAAQHGLRERCLHYENGQVSVKP